MLNTILLTLSLLLIISYFYKTNSKINQIITNLLTSLLLFVLSFVWVFTKDAIGFRFTQGRKAYGSYTPEWQTYVDIYSIIIGILCAVGGFYFIFQFIKNSTNKKSYSLKSKKKKRRKGV